MSAQSYDRVAIFFEHKKEYKEYVIFYIFVLFVLRLCFLEILYQFSNNKIMLYEIVPLVNSKMSMH